LRFLFSPYCKLPLRLLYLKNLAGLFRSNGVVYCYWNSSLD